MKILIFELKFVTCCFGYKALAITLKPFPMDRNILNRSIKFLIILVFQLVGEWWKSDVEAVINEALKSGAAPNVSDAHTINGHPGPVSSCPSESKRSCYNSIYNFIVMV